MGAETDSLNLVTMKGESHESSRNHDERCVVLWADMNLALAAKMMWDSDCGVLPVVNEEGRVIGMITDRDICMAIATKGRPASNITVWETRSGQLYSFRPQDDIHDALNVSRNLGPSVLKDFLNRRMR